MTVPPKVDPEKYAQIPPRPPGFFQHFPGIYCRACGQVFALYSYSGHPPDGDDENGKPFYTVCLLCNPKETGFPHVAPL